MILDLPRFIQQERPYWSELETLLGKLEDDPGRAINLEGVRRLHYLYQRASADLAKIHTFSGELQLRAYLESIVGRAYGEIHETREKSRLAALRGWFFRTFPQTFRRHARTFWLATGLMLVGSAFGGLAISLDPQAKQILIPFGHLEGDPSERVALEEGAKEDRLEGAKSRFSSFLMTHNIKVAISTLAMGMTWGVGTVILLFYNGVILGAVAVDYILAGQTKFLLGWLLPHGAIEIPAIVIAGQAGLMIGNALIGWGDRTPLAMRFRKIGPDLVTLIGGVAVMLVWAGIVESFMSQYHEPVLPYFVKIAFGIVELLALVVFLARAGIQRENQHTDHSNA